jgi:hypothetical protein
VPNVTLDAPTWRSEASAHLPEPVRAQTGTLARRDAFLQNIVEACASQVAVLNETGEILFLSQAWCSSFQRHGSAAANIPGH